jgi:hypothetical protein
VCSNYKIRRHLGVCFRPVEKSLSEMAHALLR